MAVEGINGALSAIHRQSLAVDQAAAKIARAGLPTAGPASGQPEVNAEAEGGDLLLQGITESIVARSNFVASIKLAQVANENVATALDIGYGVRST